MVYITNIVMINLFHYNVTNTDSLTYLPNIENNKMIKINN